jgi:branched-chain amino acid transport system substrate-binding protein
MSAEARVAFTLANSLNCPAISSSAAASGLTEEARPWTFTYATPASILTPAAIDGLVKKLSPKKSVVVLDKANPAALDQGELSAKALAAKGVSVETFTVATNDVDFGPIATRIAGVAPDLVVISTSDKAALGLLRELKRTQQKAAILITQSAFTPLISAAGAEVLEGVYRYTEFDPSSATDDRTKAFITEFKKRNDGRAPTQLSTQTYDLMFLMKDMIEKAGAKGTRDSLQSDRKQMVDLLGALKDWQSISGPMSMTPGGYTVKPATILVFHNGAPERVSGL